MVKSEPGVGRRGRRVLVVLAGGVLVLLAVVVFGSVAEHAAYAGKVLPGVHLDGTPVAGKSNNAARDAIAQLAVDLSKEPIRAHAEGRTFTVDPSLIGFSVDVDATTREVQDAGRDENPLAMATDTLLRRFRPDRIPLVVNYDPTRFEGVLDGWSTALGSGLVEGGLKFNGTTVVPVEPHPGRGLLRAEAERELAAAVRSGERTDLTLPTGDLVPQVNAAAVDAAAAKARAILATKHTIVAGLLPIPISAAQLASVMGTRVDGHNLDLTIDSARLQAMLGPAVTKVAKPPVDATFSIDSANVPSVVPSQDGRMVDIDAVANAILEGQSTIVAQFHNAHPAHDTAWAQRLGITKQVSTFTTYYPAGQPRVHNIHVAADVLNGTIVEPGQLFSENAKLGPRTPEKGYVKAPILVEDGFGEDYGGGISQLTTTLYNAVFWGGYEDVQHSPHAFYISRYPMGREATIVYPTVDLKFRNDTTHGVFIRASYSATSVTVTFYGDNDGRVVHEINRQILHTEPITDSLLPCPVSRPTLDPNNVCAVLAPGEHSTVQGGETGYDVTFTRVIDQPGKPERSMRYQVHYPMLPNRILIGAGAGGTSGSSTTGPGGTGPAPTTAKTVPPPPSTPPKTTQRRP
jgi:vancomycin resistance protein YoaR